MTRGKGPDRDSFGGCDRRDEKKGVVVGVDCRPFLLCPSQPKPRPRSCDWGVNSRAGVVTRPHDDSCDRTGYGGRFLTIGWFFLRGRTSGVVVQDEPVVLGTRPQTSPDRQSKTTGNPCIFESGPLSSSRHGPRVGRYSVWTDGPTVLCFEWVSTSHRGRAVPSGSGVTVDGFPDPASTRVR